MNALDFALHVQSAPVFTWRGEIQPVPLHRSRVVFRGRTVRSYNVDADVIYRQDLQTLWSSVRPRVFLQGDLAVSLAFAGNSRKSRNRPDVSNLIKAVEDAGNEYLWVDDRQIRIVAGQIIAWGRDVEPWVSLDVWRIE